MSEPSFLEELRWLRSEWHDPEVRKGFWVGLRPYLFAFPIYVLGGVAFGYALSKLFS